MTSAPERIWVNLDDREDGCCPVESDLDDLGKFFAMQAATEYIRADLVPQWQPIETAPRDDTAIMAYCQPCREFPNGRMMMWRASILQTAIDGGPRHLQFPATHWMPLPKPPA